MVETFRCGHVKSEENTQVRGNGYTWCKTCRNAQKREHREPRNKGQIVSNASLRKRDFDHFRAMRDGSERLLSSIMEALA